MSASGWFYTVTVAKRLTFAVQAARRGMNLPRWAAEVLEAALASRGCTHTGTATPPADANDPDPEAGEAATGPAEPAAD